MGDTLRDLEYESRRKMTETQEMYAQKKKIMDDFEKLAMPKTVVSELRIQEACEGTKKYYCGIDPGFTGGIAIIDGEQRIIEVHDMPLHGVKSKQEIDCNKVIAILLNYQLSHVAIEKCQAMPKQGCVSMFRYGDGYGQIKGICAALELKHTLVTPQSWKKRMMQGMAKGKGASIVRAKQLFGFIPTKKEDHGRAEAVLIAEHGRLLITGEVSK